MPQDAKAISDLFREIYGYNYAYPLIYNIDHLKNELSKKSNYWFIGELINKKEIAGTGLLERKRYIVHTSQAVVKKKYQGRGITTNIGSAGITKVLKMPEFKNVLRLDSEVRGMKIGAQRLNEKAGAIPFCFIPGYINWGDKRAFKISNNHPVPPIEEESAFFYAIILNPLWAKREKEIYLLDNEDLLFFYNYVKISSRKMKKDFLIFENGENKRAYELYGVSKDYYEGRVNLFGYIKEKSLKHLLKTYKNWRLIIWRIPTTKNGISSMSLAIKKGFKCVGYDIGFNNINWTLFDSVIFAFYPNGIQSLEVNCLDKAKPLVKKVNELISS
ncbi:MAG: hypothetical protein ACFE9Z_09805 [Promethearchaeota archaeon]